MMNKYAYRETGNQLGCSVALEILASFGRCAYINAYHGRRMGRLGRANPIDLCINL